MMLREFEYIAVDRAGAQRRGLMIAPNEQEAYRKVAAGGVTPLRIAPVRQTRGRGPGKKITQRDIAQFTHQFAVLLEARIPVSDGLRSIGDQETNGRLQSVILEMASKIQAGSTITDAMAPHQRDFGDVYIETIRAAERSGSMIKVLEHLAEMSERQIETSQQVRQALMYPALVLMALGSAALFLIAFVVPKFATMFAQRGVELPALTRLLQALGVSLHGFWWLYGLCGFAAIWSVRRAWAAPSGRAFLDRCLHRVPYLKRVLIGLAVGRFSRVFGICLASGLGLIESLEMSGRAAGRPSLMKDTDRMIDQVRQGGRLGEALRGCRYLPAFAKRMISAGEESAELTRMCGVVSRHYEREVGHLTKNAATVIEPVLIAVLTGVVLMVALAVFLPMWNMMSLMK